ncbi:MAG TPA: O-antigen ligase family protein [Tepidisphaeraceae bacterium]|jgi:hypothetical protein|nr:O-antigen ligase family protein [Tepidisphaeraceae bacterium]
MSRAHPVAAAAAAHRSVEYAPSRADLLPQLGATSVADVYLKFHCFVLMMLALMGRGFAYMGLSELSLVLSLGVVIFCPVGVKRIFTLFPAVILLPYLLWGAAQTLPYLEQYGFLAARDAAQWGYGIWGLTLGAILASRPARIVTLVTRYRSFGRIAVCVLPLAYAYHTLIGFPPFISGIGFIELKAGETLVHIGAIGAFLWIAPIPSFKLTAQLFAPAFVVVFLLGNRAGQIACMLQLCSAIMVRGVTGAVLKTVMFIFIPLSIFAVSGATIMLGNREVSLDRLTAAATSVFGTSGESRYDNTKEWRLNWWGDIIDYTVYGPYFWTGKGFGVNLADDDGYQIASDSALRSPHNSHITMLARAGVPGFIMHVLLNLTWATGMATCAIDAYRRRRRTWYRLLMFLGIFWAAITVNAGFDVVLEGPMASAWFWTIFGTGMAAVWTYRNAPGAIPDTIV